jgi:antitoxin HicB
MPYNQSSMALLPIKTYQGVQPMPVYRYTAVFEPADEGGFVVTVPALAGLVTEGATLEEARAMVKDAVRGYLQSLMKHGEEIPIDPNPATLESVEVELEI